MELIDRAAIEGGKGTMVVVFKSRISICGSNETGMIIGECRMGIFIVVCGIFISSVGDYCVGGEFIHWCFHFFNAQTMILVGCGDGR